MKKILIFAFLSLTIFITGCHKDQKKNANTLILAKQGNRIAQTKMGFIFYHKKVYDKALYWFKKSSLQNYPIAQYNLAILYYNGLGTIKNYKKSILWLEKASSQGYAEASYYLGGISNQNKFIEISKKDTIKWYTLSATQGYVPAQKKLIEIYTKSKNISEQYKWNLVLGVDKKILLDLENKLTAKDIYKDQSQAEEIKKSISHNIKKISLIENTIKVARLKR